MNTFWLNRGTWQADTSEYVFLANAVIQLGKALYPDEWTGLEPAYQFPVKPVAKRYLFPSEDYKRRFEENEKDYERRKTEAMKRLVLFQGVMAKIVSEAERPNGLQTAYRPKGGYGFKPVPREWWQVSNYPARFKLCQINTAAPGDPALAGMGSTWAHIFVSRHGLESLIERISNPNTVNASGNSSSTADHFSRQAHSKPGRTESVTSPAQARAVRTARGPRRRRWDWSGAWAYLTAEADLDGFDDKSQADIERMVTKWFADRNDGEAPAPSHVRKNVVRYFEAIEDRNDRSAG